MLPWFWYWSPQFHYPLSGSVTQDFFQSINPAAGVGHIEKQIFDVASYGRQLGLINEVLLSLARPEDLDSDDARASLQRLHAIRDDIEKVKDANRHRLAETAAEVLEKLEKADPAALSRLLDRYHDRALAPPS